MDARFTRANTEKLRTSAQSLLTNKSFLVLFFKKELLPFYYDAPPGMDSAQGAGLKHRLGLPRI
jgi:hypothetical protein